MSLFWSPLRVTGDAFYSTKTSSLNFQQLPGANGTAFSKLSKTGQPREVYPNFRNFFLRSFSPFNFAPAKSRIFGWMVCILEIQQVFFFNLERAYSLWCACGGQVKRSRKWGGGFLPSSHSDLSAMPIMFITPSGLPIGWILAIHPSHTIPREWVEETAEIEDMVKLKEMAQTQRSLLSPFVSAQEKKDCNHKLEILSTCLRKNTSSYKEH